MCTLAELRTTGTGSPFGRGSAAESCCSSRRFSIASTSESASESPAGAVASVLPVVATGRDSSVLGYIAAQRPILTALSQRPRKDCQQCQSVSSTSGSVLLLCRIRELSRTTSLNRLVDVCHCLGSRLLQWCILITSTDAVFGAVVGRCRSPPRSGKSPSRADVNSLEPLVPDRAGAKTQWR
jgi:hypothetical protein